MIYIFNRQSLFLGAIIMANLSAAIVFCPLAVVGGICFTLAAFYHWPLAAALIIGVWYLNREQA
jgi:hypothetical protein